MIDITKDIHPLTDFKRRTVAFLKQMKRTGHPLVLTVNGKAEIVVLDARSYQEMMAVVERARAIEGIQKGLDAFARHEGRPAGDALEAIRRKHAIPR